MNSLKRFVTYIMWFVKPLSINQKLDFLVEKHVATNKWSSFSSSLVTWTSASYFWDLFLQITALWPSGLQLFHYASGLFKQLNGGLPFCHSADKVGKFFLALLPLLWVLWLASKAPSTIPPCLISFLCSCAYNVFSNS